MTDEVNQSPESPMEGSPKPEVDPLVAIHPSVEEKNNIMTVEKLDLLRESYSIPLNVQIRLPEEGATIVSARLGEARYKETLLGGYPSIVKSSVESQGRYTVPVLLDSKSFCRVFVSPGSMASGTLGEERPKDRATSLSGDAGEKVHDPILDPFLNALSLGSDSTSEFYSDSGLPPEFKLDGEVIGKMRPRDDPSRSTNKKSKAASSPNVKEATIAPEPEKKMTRPGDVIGLKAVSLKPTKGSLPSLGTVLGPMASILGNPSIVGKILRGAISPVLVLRSSLAVRSREAIDELVKIKVNHNFLTDKLERLGILVVELREAVDTARSSVMEEFKSSSYFLGAVENATSKYFGEGFDFYKW
ncbi:hypothetical protein Acr_27g0000090 [Actinidia rufa]|uniref:Uncharacterized protein n=1 Tax=Actinidia rufa TaxID=165716 RepID=A0A7J0H5A2_9ERIC|nr:hypothetical protein Acr_27g0000090 [Actinidia rufa]